MIAVSAIAWPVGPIRVATLGDRSDDRSRAALKVSCTDDSDLPGDPFA